MKAHLFQSDPLSAVAPVAWRLGDYSGEGTPTIGAAPVTQAPLSHLIAITPYQQGAAARAPAALACLIAHIAQIDMMQSGGQGLLSRLKQG